MAATIQCPACKRLMAEQSDGFYVDAHGTLIYTNTYRCHRCNRTLTIETGPNDTRTSTPPTAALVAEADTLIRRSRDASCSRCIDGYMPAGIALHIGPIYLACLACQEECPDCGSDCMFPASWGRPDRFIEAMLTAGLDPEFCTGCAGVIRVIPISQRPSDF